MGHVGMRKLSVVDSATGVPAVPAMTDDRARLLQHAMLSVYYASVARQLTVSGAPSVLVPAAMPPLSLAEALAILDDDPAGGHARLTAAIWLLVRSSPIPRRGEPASLGLPAELLPYLQGRDLEVLAQSRRAARAAATQLGAFLLAFRDGDKRARRNFQAWMRRKDAHSFSDAMTGMLHDSIGTGEYAQTHGSVKDEQLLAHIASLEFQTGTAIDTFLRDLAAADAFAQFMRGGQDPMTPDGDGSIDVIPVATVVTQDASTLVTTATATTLVRGDFEHLVAATQPAEWSRSSDVVRKSVYVDDPFCLHVPDPQPAAADGQPMLLRELAAMSWGSKEGQESTFSNVLRVTSSVTRRAPAHAACDGCAGHRHRLPAVPQHREPRAVGPPTGRPGAEPGVHEGPPARAGSLACHLAQGLAVQRPHAWFGRGVVRVVRRRADAQLPCPHRGQLVGGDRD